MAVIFPVSTERIYAPYKVAALVETLREEGISPDSVLNGSGIDFAQVHDPNTLTSIEQYLAICRNAIHLTLDPAIPFMVGSRIHLSAYGMYGYALMSSVTVRDFFIQAVKYHRLATPMLTLDWREEKNSAIWLFASGHSSNSSQDVQRFLIEQQLSQIFTQMGEVVSTDCIPSKVCVSYPAPPHASLYSQLLKCPVLFDQPASEIHYDGSILDQIPQFAHRLTSTLLQATCDRLLGQIKTSVGIVGEVYQSLIKTPGSFPGMEQVATSLNTTPRTLRRKLEAHGTSFAEIASDVRTSIAIEYLQTTKMTVEDIASLLGFSDTANFRHAFKKWTGKKPSAYRNS